MQLLNTTFLETAKEALLHCQESILEYYSDKESALAYRFTAVLKQGLSQLHQYQKEGGKGTLAYVQASFLMSGQESGEHRLKIDFYDERFYRDPWEIDCFWDYSVLLPPEEETLGRMIRYVKKKLPGTMDYEIIERLPTYRLGQMSLLQNVAASMFRQESALSLLSAETDEDIYILYGAYMGSFQKLFTISGNKGGTP